MTKKLCMRYTPCFDLAQTKFLSCHSQTRSRESSESVWKGSLRMQQFKHWERRTESGPVLKELIASYGHDKNHLTYQQKDWNNKKQTELWIYLINLLALWPRNEQLWISPIFCCVKSGRIFLLFQQIALVSRQTSCKMQKQYTKLMNYFLPNPIARILQQKCFVSGYHVYFYLHLDDDVSLKTYTNMATP